VDLRDSAATYTSTIKSDEAQSRRELTETITAKEYFEQEAKTTKIIRKTRFSFNYIVKDVVFVIELDYFGNRDEFLIEVEHDDMEMLELFHANRPFFCGENVTLDSRYKNKNIACFGFPKV
jgi:CYTH domain-containing protein